MSISANQYPDQTNYFTRMIRSVVSVVPMLMRRPADFRRPLGISIYMRVKDERDWIETSITSIRGIADEIIVSDNGSTDGTYEILQDLAGKEKGFIKLSSRPHLHHAELSNFALEQTAFHWVLRWDGDMVAHTSGNNPISELRSRLLELPAKRYYVIYLRHVNLAGDLFHQDPQEMVHIEEYAHTFSRSASFVQPGRFEAVEFPLYYRPLFWYEPYAFHMNIKSAHRMLLRHFWEDWMALKDFQRYPTLNFYVMDHIKSEFGTSSIEEAQHRHLTETLKDYIPYNPGILGPYPELLKPHLNMPKYRIVYKNGHIYGRESL
jgi:glycosyltransferase involved in cell wall biosynthesis